MTWDSEQQDAAAGLAALELERMLAAGPGRVEGVVALYTWWTKYEMVAGHTRLFRALRATLKARGELV